MVDKRDINTPPIDISRVGMKIKLLRPMSIVPVRAHHSDAGLDVFTSSSFTIPAGARQLVPTGIAVRPSSGCYVRIAPRSGLSIRGIDVGAGVVDDGYTGEVQVLLINNTGKELSMPAGAKIAQMIEEVHVRGDPEIVDDLGYSDRAAMGFGSTN